jgi:hypothetical protein
MRGSVLASLRRAHKPILTFALTYLVAVLAGMAMVHAGNAFGLASRDRIVAAAQATSVLQAFHKGNRLSAAMLDSYQPAGGSRECVLLPRDRDAAAHCLFSRRWCRSEPGSGCRVGAGTVSRRQVGGFAKGGGSRSAEDLRTGLATATCCLSLGVLGSLKCRLPGFAASWLRVVPAAQHAHAADASPGFSGSRFGFWMFQGIVMSLAAESVGS